ncbi:hypothetical protein GLYMA_03G068000v4 [Glycine max]|nr:hypothetical protein GLYMA_03G068000v4 [Glycine max]KAG5042505.1 hypothetical protein JHK87_006420 [Glycine soja]KAG5071360.1 hypothetical protein JHK86_006571 [Glycine max]
MIKASDKLFLETQNYPCCLHLSLRSLHFFFATSSYYFSFFPSNVHTSEPFKLKLLSPLKDFLESQNRKQMQKSEMLHHFDNLHRPIMCFSSRVSLADDISGHCSVASTTSSASGLRFLRSKCSRSEFELNETNPCAGRKSSSCAGTVTSGNGRLSLNSFDNSLGSKFGSEFEQDGLYWF